MGATVIIALIAGAALFTASFFMPDINRGVSKQMDEEEERRLIKGMMDEEMVKFRSSMEDATQECIEDNRDKMERAMDRITNEKMNAVNEYSDTVLEQIHKDHEEAMFLYDMLNNKYAQVKNTAAEVNQLSKSVQVKANEMREVEAKAAETVARANATMIKAGETISTMVGSNPSIAEIKSKMAEANANFGDNSNVERKDAVADKGNTVTAEPAKTRMATEQVVDIRTSTVEMVPFESFTAEKTEVEVPVEVSATRPVKKEKKNRLDEKVRVADQNLDLMFATNNNSTNNNEEILRLHKEGKSNMAIAKQLGLGIGEVKLVIDLFEGI